MRTIFYLIFIILILPISSALDFGIVPSQSTLGGNVNEEICQWIQLIGGESNFEGDVKWAAENTKNIRDYKISSQSLNIKTKFPRYISSGKYEVCFLVEESGEYYGALKYKIENSSYGIVSWIKLSVYEKESLVLEEMENKTNLLSGNSIKKTNKENFALGGILIFLLTTLIFLVFVRKK